MERDTDKDELDDADEIRAGTNVNLPDTDHDGLTDGVELVSAGTDPLLEDTDGDGLEDGFEIGKSLNPLGEDDDSHSFLTLHYTFESGEGTEIENLAGGRSGVLYSWDLDGAWGAGDAGDSRGSGFLRFEPVDPEVEAENVHFIEEIEGLEGSEVSDGSTIVATGQRPRETGMTEDGYTVMAWVRLEALSGFLLPRLLLSQPGRDRLALGFYGLLPFQSHQGLSESVRSTGQVTMGRWHHLSWRYDRGGVALFIDGRESDRYLNRLPIANQDSEIIIGWLTSARGFTGGLDEVRIYTAPLTESKIRTLAGLPASGGDDFQITLVQRTPGGIEIVWPDEGADGHYTVEYSGTLRGEWTAIGTMPSTDGPSASYRDSDAVRLRKPSGYYRVRRAESE